CRRKKLCPELCRKLYRFSDAGLHKACVACVTAAPARREAATIAASVISASVAPALRALALWMSMQYGHCVVRATAMAINSLYFTGIAPSATDIRSNSQKAFITSGARLFIFLILARFALLYISWFVVLIVSVSSSL